MGEVELWRKGAEELDPTPRDHDERKAFRSGWIDMEKFLFMCDLVKREIP